MKKFAMVFPGQGSQAVGMLADLANEYPVVTETFKQASEALGYDFNTVEFAVRDGIPYAIDFCNPAPDADKNSVGEENFAWIVEHAAKLAIEKAKEYVPGKPNISWGNFVKDSVK